MGRSSRGATEASGGSGTGTIETRTGLAGAPTRPPVFGVEAALAGTLYVSLSLASLIGRVTGALERERVVQVSCGESHTMCVTALGGLWSWGCGRQRPALRAPTQPD